MKLKSLLLLGTILLSSCATTEFVTPKIPIPPEPDYVTFKYSELQCLPDDVKKRVVDKVLQLKGYNEELKSVLEPYQ